MLVLTNELAGRTEADAVQRVVDVLSTAGRVERVTCSSAEDLDRALDARAGRTLVVVGGDGSLHTTVRRLWQRGEAADCVCGLIPLGTGNDFARGVGIPLDPQEAAHALMTGVTTPLDLVVDDADGVVVNAVHVGAGAEAALAARPLKPWLKIAAFPIGAFVAGLRAKGWRLRVHVDGHRVASGRRPVLMVGVSNAPSIAGGTATLGPAASPVDGRLDVTVSFATGPLARVGYALALRRGAHPARTDVHQLTGREIAVTGDAFWVNADGELTGPVTARTWRVAPAAWRLVLPADSPTTA
ncbi:diacylglycerol/lipid kinase family protein [Luedemannella helvata]|uniref:diacylglycerol/lipid kinase family protein n=1 Tax=Luedemannella helvata TaxID=349315 RepID=UPI0031D163C4